MLLGGARPWGAIVKACVLLASTSWTSPGTAATPLELPEREDAPGVVIYPAAADGARAIAVVLHGMCSEPANVCAHFTQVSQEQHLICPRARQRCDGGGSIWPALGFEPQIEAAVARARAVLGERVDDARGRTLIGYSLGAFRALELAEQGGQRYPRVMLIGAKVRPSLPRLRAAGVERLLLSAGSWDMMHDHMRRETARLRRRGFGAEFLGLGPVGHFFTPSFQRYLPQALVWLEGGALEDS